MPKRKVQPVEDSDDELGSEEFEEEEDYKPKKKTTAAAKKAAGTGSQKGTPSKSPKKASKFTEAFEDPLGWTVEPPSLIWRDFGDVEGSKKIAAFDLDSTLVNRKGNAKFARDASDWKWWNKQTPKKLAELAEEGYKIVIFTNQGSIKGALDGKAKEKVEAMVELIYTDLQAKAKGVDVPLQCFMAPSMQPDDPCRKPATGMWQHMVEHCNYGIKPDLKQSFFVGDADGSSGAHSDSDKRFAAAIGLEFKTPVDFFGPMEGKANIDAAALKAAAESVETGDNPNSDLVLQLRDLSERMLEQSKATGDVSMGFKGRAVKKAADSIATFHEAASNDNLKEMQKLAGVGKGTIARIKQYVATGQVYLDDELEEQKAAEGGAAHVPPSPADKKKKQAEAFAFM